jgi:glycosyltransferase involved in cell wall biosynthesis
MELPLVTIITPTLNQGRFIEKTIRSVLDQDYPHIEYIVVDGGSTDNTIEILKKHENRLKWISEPDKGQADAINKGILKSTGSILGWLNSDDMYCKNAIRTAVDHFRMNPDTYWIYGDGYQIDIRGNILRKFPYSRQLDLKRLITVEDYILQPTVFIRREPLLAVGLIDSRLNWCFDWDLWIRLAKKYRADYVPAFLAYARCYHSTKTSTGDWKRLREILETMRKHGSRRYPIGFLLHLAATIRTHVQLNYPLAYRAFFQVPFSILGSLYRKDKGA